MINWALAPIAAWKYHRMELASGCRLSSKHALPQAPRRLKYLLEATLNLNVSVDCSGFVALLP